MRLLLTFDGFYTSQLDNAVPVLESLRAPATFFPVSHDLEADAGCRAHLVSLLRAGHTIGCHTHTHPDLTTLDADALEREIGGSKRRLEDALGAPVTAFCYPDGACNARVARVVERAGFEVAFTVDLGGARPGDDPYRLKRVPILGEPTRAAFETYLAGTRFVSGALLLWWKIRERL